MDDVEADLEPDRAATALSLALKQVTDKRLFCRPNRPFSAMATAFAASLDRELVAWLDVHGLAA